VDVEFFIKGDAIVPSLFLFFFLHASTDRPARLMNKDRTACKHASCLNTLVDHLSALSDASGGREPSLHSISFIFYSRDFVSRKKNTHQSFMRVS